MANNQEIELKLLVSKENLKKLLALDFVKQAIRPNSKQKRKLISSYYDTQDLALKDHGIAYRVRDKGDGTFEATVKTSQSSSGGISERLELNLPLPEPKPVLAGFQDLGLKYDLEELAPEGVGCLFTVKVDRTIYLLDLGTALVELALDKGKIIADKLSDPIDEIELELLEGDKATLLQFAAKLTSSVPMFVEKRSKFARGLALRGFNSDLKAPKVKLGEGLISQQLLALVSYHGDLLLQLQNKLLADKLTPLLVKKLYKQSGYLLACGALAQTMLAVDCHICQEKLDQWQRALKKLERLLYLQAAWQQLEEACKDILSKPVLGKKLNQALAEAKTELLSLGQQGSLTAAYYSLLSRLLRYQPVEEAQALDLVDQALETWSKEPGHSQSLYYLAKATEGKHYSKLAAASKKQWQKEEQENLPKDLEQLLGQLQGKSTSKYMSRDIGLLLGWLLAQK